MKVTLKKLLSAFMVAALLAGILAGCGNTAAQQTDHNSDQHQITNTTPAGMLVLSTEASVKISYDADGMVLSVTGMNDHGIVLSDTYTDYMGKTCAAVAKELILASSDAGHLSSVVKNIVIKQAAGSALPGSHFLETVTAEVEAGAKEVGSAATVTTIDETCLDEDGYINLDTAKTLLLNELGGETYDEFYGGTFIHEDSYVVTVVVKGLESAHTINAVTGLIYDATDEDLLGNPEDYTESDDYVYDYESEYENYDEALFDEELPEESGSAEPTVEATTAN